MKYLLGYQAVKNAIYPIFPGNCEERMSKLPGNTWQ